MNAPATPAPNPRPDVTPVQALSLGGWTTAQAVAFAWLNSPRGQLALSIGATVLASAWHLADAIIRNGRNRHPVPSPPTG